LLTAFQHLRCFSSLFMVSINRPIYDSQDPTLKDNFDVDHDRHVARFCMRLAVENAFDAGKDTISSLHLLEESFMIFQISFQLKIGDPTNKAINRKISQLTEAGIFQKWEKDRIMEINKLKRDKLEVLPPPVVGKLTLEHVGLCFFAILICLSLSCVVFALECVTNFVLKKLNYR
jgi:hypothetical protein